MSKAPEAKELRNFGLAVGGIFVAIGLWPTVLRGEDPRVWALVIGGSLITPALVWPQSLRLVYLGWTTIGHGMAWINTKLLLGMIFYGLFTPIRLLMRLSENDPMRRKFEPEADTYRVVRRPRPGSHMRRQF